MPSSSESRASCRPSPSQSSSSPKKGRRASVPSPPVLVGRRRAARRVREVDEFEVCEMGGVGSTASSVGRDSSCAHTPSAESGRESRTPVPSPPGAAFRTCGARRAPSRAPLRSTPSATSARAHNSISRQSHLQRTEGGTNELTFAYSNATNNLSHPSRLVERVLTASMAVTVPGRRRVTRCERVKRREEEDEVGSVCAGEGGGSVRQLECSTSRCRPTIYRMSWPAKISRPCSVPRVDISRE